MENNKVGEKLQYIFENVNNWLNFAEAKNAVLIAFNIAMIAAITSGDLLNDYTTMICIITVICILSTIISLLSFIPKTNNKLMRNLYNHTIGIIDLAIEKIFKEDNEKNLIFYGYISKYEYNKANLYLDELKNSYFPRETNITDFEIDLAKEIIINSKIAKRKYNYFKAALYTLIIGMLLLFVIVILVA